MGDWSIHDCEVKYYKMKLAELEAKNKDLEDTVKFFKKQAEELRYQKDDLIWQNDAFRKREATWQEDMRKAEERAAWLDYRVQSLLSMEAAWLGDKRKAESYALALEDEENITWAETQILIDELKKELQTKDGQLDAMRTLNDSMEDMLSQTKKKLEETKKGLGAGQAVRQAEALAIEWQREASAAKTRAEHAVVELREAIEARGRTEDRNDELSDVNIELQDEITELHDEIDRLKEKMPIPGAAIYATEAARDFYTGLPKTPKIPAKGEKCSLCHQKMKKDLPGASHVEEKMERFRGQTGY